jgi:predicted house-cleaning noncanonical NTP pyrophosphatase (MazG superfamily)
MKTTTSRGTATLVDDLDHLNSFLRGEISAVETYDQALEKLADQPSVRERLQDARSSHQERVSLLRTEITKRGGEPAEGSGAWGSFAKLVEGGAKVFGAKAAIAALEEGEDHGRDDYRRDLEDLSLEVRRLVESQLLPAQLRTHDLMSALKHSA